MRIYSYQCALLHQLGLLHDVDCLLPYHVTQQGTLPTSRAWYVYLSMIE